jgi:hypothetical protein
MAETYGFGYSFVTVDVVGLRPSPRETFLKEGFVTSKNFEWPTGSKMDYDKKPAS